MQNGINAVVFILYLAIVGLVIYSWWRIFKKAGQPAWGSLVPIYNLYLMLKIAGKPGWWTILLLIPVVNVVFIVLTLLALSRNFGKGTGFAVGMILLTIVFAPILAFSDAQYTPAAPKEN